MFANTLRITATILIVPLVFGCAGWRSATSPGTASGESNSQAYPAVQETRQHYAQSIADYRVCLAANQTDTRACDAKRLIMEKDETDLDQLSSGERALRASAGPRERGAANRCEYRQAAGAIAEALNST